jgi:hypothetical protein
VSVSIDELWINRRGDANEKVVEMMLPPEIKEFQDRFGPSKRSDSVACRLNAVASSISEGVVSSKVSLSASGGRTFFD